MSTQANRVAIVTGASRGIGAAVAQRLARDGFAVALNYAGDTASAEALVKQIEAAGGKAIAVKADVADAAAVRALFANAEQHPPDSPEPAPEQERDEDGCRVHVRDASGHPRGDECSDEGGDRERRSEARNAIEKEPNCMNAAIPIAAAVTPGPR